MTDKEIIDFLIRKKKRAHPCDTDKYEAAISALQERVERRGNEPLTFEQLREMDGEPVWVQNLEEPEKSQWRLLHWDRGKYLVLQGISVRGYLTEEYGESWLAYRRPPVEEGYYD